MSYRYVDTSRRVIDLATGILVGLRGCSEQEAFAELVAAVHRTGVGLGAIARALVAITGPADQSVPHQAEAFDLWADLLAARTTAFATR
ncbi:ANTAR domain-containing protein [Mycobacterium sp. NBC_00419]|uniref:ANTAR domain-containing protein n=1 Tax=Mycobacterium sp. NBC_00419 TaxID=2975989 RepID=UPI002E239845